MARSKKPSSKAGSENINQTRQSEKDKETEILENWGYNLKVQQENDEQQE